MMADVVKIEGLGEISARLKKLPEQVERRVLTSAMRKAGTVIEDIARDNALSMFQGEGFMADHIGTRGKKRKHLGPGIGGGAYVAVLSDVKEGGLKQVKKLTGQKVAARSKFGIRHIFAQDKATRRASTNKTGLTGFKGGPAFYWRFLEFGTSKMPARPFMRPAAQAGSGRASAVAIEEMKKGIERVAKKLAKRK